MITDEEKSAIDEKIRREESARAHDQELRFYEAEARRLNRANERKKRWDTDARPRFHAAGLTLLMLSLICCVWYSATGFSGYAYGFWLFALLVGCGQQAEETLRQLREGSKLKSLRSAVFIFCAYWLLALILLAIPFGYAHQYGLNKDSMFWAYVWYYCQCGAFVVSLGCAFAYKGFYKPDENAK